MMQVGGQRGLEGVVDQGLQQMTHEGAHQDVVKKGLQEMR